MRKRKGQQIDIYETKKNKGLRNRETNIISFFFAGLFFMMMGYLVYFNVIVAPDIVNNPYNKRVDNKEVKVIRGSIYASDGSLLAETQTDEDGNESRVYPYGNLFCHVVGLSSAKTGVEGIENYDLLSDSGNMVTQIQNDMSGEKALGNDCVTTLNPNLQEAAYNAIGDDKGAVILMEVKTGRVLAMVSKPDYDPNDASTDYSEWLTYDSSDSVLLNRATQGLYAPGSTFKMVTALEYIKENPNYDNFNFNCSGTVYLEGGTTIPCFAKHAHGSETLEMAFANSCNCAFSTIGAELDRESYRNTCEDLFFNKSLPIDMEYSKSSFLLNENSALSEAQETGMGQGKTMISPMHNLMIAASIANDGVMMKPMFVDSVETSDGTVIKQNEPQEYATVMTSEESAVLRQYMRAVVTKGTVSSMRNSSYNAAGKTGMAQYDNSENYHSWFVGFAPYEDPEVAICVVLEGGFSHSDSANALAKKVFDAYFE